MCTIEYAQSFAWIGGRECQNCYPKFGKYQVPQILSHLIFKTKFFVFLQNVHTVYSIDIFTTFLFTNVYNKPVNRKERHILLVNIFIQI